MSFLDRFKTNKTTVVNEEYTDFTAVISSSGDFTKITNIDVILQSIYVILITPKKSYPDDPNFGSDLYKCVFDQDDEYTMERIKSEINNSIGNYDDRIKITKIDISFFTNKKGFKVDVYINYEGVSTSITVKFGEFFN